MEFKDFIQYYKIPSMAEDGIAFGEINPDIINVNDTSPMIKDIHLMIFVISGSMEIEISNKRHHLLCDCFADIVMCKTFSLICASDNLHAFAIVMTKEYEAKLVKMPFTTGYVLDRIENPVVLVEKTNLVFVAKNIYNIKRAFNDVENKFRSSLLKHYLWIFYAEIINIFPDPCCKYGRKADGVNRKQILFMKFVNMLSQYVCKHRTLDFYASKLCISPQYLERIVKELSRKTFYSWITEYLMVEVIRMLEETNMSIQQIADELNFSDQAVRARFFKKNKGLSPFQYRNHFIQ